MFSGLLPPFYLKHLSEFEASYLDSTLKFYSGLPSQQQLWSLLDAEWINLNCTHHPSDPNVGLYYRHPVWLLNGIYAEHDPVSQGHRHRIAEKLSSLGCHLICDLGGGFGTLPRILSSYNPTAHIDILEPYAHPLARALASSLCNVRYADELKRTYDLFVCTDVLEHIPDPLEYICSTTSHLRLNGYLFIAQSFSPEILCHIPSLFHLQYCLPSIMRILGFRSVTALSYGVLYQKYTQPRLRLAYQVSKFFYYIFVSKPFGTRLSNALISRISFLLHKLLP